MPNTLQSLGIDKLTWDERRQLLDDLWDSLTGEGLGEIPQAHRDELDRRLSDREANPAAERTWEEARAWLREQP